MGAGLKCNGSPNPSRRNKISLNRIDISKSNSLTGPHATSLANSGFLHNCSNEYFSFKF